MSEDTVTFKLTNREFAAMLCALSAYDKILKDDGATIDEIVERAHNHTNIESLRSDINKLVFKLGSYLPELQ